MPLFHSPSPSEGLEQPTSLVGNSPYCLPHNSYDVSLENLVLNQRRSVLSYLLDIALTL